MHHSIMAGISRQYLGRVIQVEYVETGGLVLPGQAL